LLLDTKPISSNIYVTGQYISGFRFLYIKDIVKRFFTFEYEIIELLWSVHIDFDFETGLFAIDSDFGSL